MNTFGYKRNFLKIPFSYVVLRKGPRSTFDEVGRLVGSTEKVKSKVTFDVCSSEGLLESWSVTKSQGTEIYSQARKVKKGALWTIPPNHKGKSNLINSKAENKDPS